MYSINFINTNEKCCLSLYYNGVNSYLFVNGTEICKFKATDSKEYIYDFSVDYDATDVDDIKDIHKYLMKKNNIV